MLQQTDNPVMPRSYGGIQTFEKIGEHRQHDYDHVAVDYAQDYANAEYARAEKVAADERLTPQAKGEDIHGILDAALQEVQTRVQGQLESVERQLRETARKAQRPLAPSAEEAAQLAYVKDALTARAHGKGGDKVIMQEWEKALEIGDLLTVRVLLDGHGENLIRSARPKDRAELSLGRSFDELIRRSEDAIATPEQKKARADLLKLEATRIRLHEVQGNVQRQFKNARLQGNNLIDGQRAAMFDSVRRGW